MKIVQQTDVLADRYGIEKALDLIADAGFDGYDYSAFHMKDDSSPMNGENYMDLAKKIKAKADERGLKCYQAHAPFPSAKKDDKVFNAGIKEKIIRSMEIAAFLGAEMIVVHPMQHLPYTMNAEKLYELNRAFYRSLIPYAEKFGIKIIDATTKATIAAAVIPILILRSAFFLIFFSFLKFCTKAA